MSFIAVGILNELLLTPFKYRPQCITVFEGIWEHEEVLHVNIP